MDFQTRTIPVRDLIALAKLAHAAHDQSIDWRVCLCASCRTLTGIIYPAGYPEPTFKIIFSWPPVEA